MAELCPFIYSVDLDLLSKRQYRSCVLPFKVYDAIRTAQGIERFKRPRLAGLDAFLGWAAPCVDAVGDYRDSNAYTLRFLTLDCSTPQEELNKQLSRALMLWVGMACPKDKSAAVAALLTSTGARPNISWSPPTGTPVKLVAGGTSAFPMDPALFELLAIAAGRDLEGESVNPGTHHEGRLAMAAPRLKRHVGQQLLRVAPAANEHGKASSLFTEVFTLVPRTDPERRVLQLMVQVGTRVYGSGSPSRHRDRHVDLYLRSNAFFGGGTSRPRVIDLAVQLRHLSKSADGSRKWTGGEREWLDQILATEFPGCQWPSLGLESYWEGDFGAMVRQGSVHGDFTSVGYGVSAIERQQYMELLDRKLASAGMERIALERFSPKGSNQWRPHRVARGKALVQQVQSALGPTDGKLHLCVLRQSDATKKHVAAALEEALGCSSSVEDDCIRLEGLSVQIHEAPSGPCSQRLELRAEVPDVPEADGAARQRIEQSVRERVLKQRQQEITTYIGECFKQVPRPAGLWIEMDERLRLDPETDPYALNYAAAYSLGFAPQVKLVQHDSKEREKNEREMKAEAGKDVSTVLDILRSLGVVLLEPHEFEFHSWSLINSGSNTERLQTPCRIRSDGRSMRVAVLDTSGAVSEVSYLEAQAAIRQRRVLNLHRLSNEEKSQKLERFFASVLPEPNRKAIVLVEADNLRQHVKGLQNKLMQPGRLELGRVGAAAPIATLSSGGNHSLVRLGTEARPTYFVRGNAMGTMRGIFKEAQSSALFWLVRPLVTALDKNFKGRAARLKSRFEEGASKLASVNRVFPTMTEIFPQVIGADFTAGQLADIARKATVIHTSMRFQTDEAVLPFPLHEASLLS